MTEQSEVREYKKGNWSVEEAMVLIEAKKMDDERRLNKDQTTKPTELRWKWVEDYCWRNGCFRSQNQCNDKWDNLMRDYKKVRDHEKMVNGENGSYWKMDKTQRKDKGLPSLMLPQIYQALVAVVDTKATLTPKPNPSIGLLVLQNHFLSPPHNSPEYSDSGAKRRRRSGEGSGGSGSRSSVDEVSNAICKSASMIAEAIEASEEREERRHKEVLSLHEKRLKVEESEAELNREGFSGLVESINKLANSIYAMASSSSSSKNQPK